MKFTICRKMKSILFKKMADITHLLEKYNVPVPRYTSYPPANFFSETFSASDFEAAIKASNQSEPQHLSFYIHIPFCRHLCHYCGCNSFAMQKPARVTQYIDALHREMDRILPLIAPDRKIAQIHYGGGSPTTLPSKVLKELNSRLLSSFQSIDRPEIAIECHPAYLDEKYWDSLIEAGFNRFSIGIQDFNEKVLKTVNRRPSLLPLETIFKILREKGARINMDFLYGLPLQTAESFRESILKAAALQPDRLVTFSYAHVPNIYRRQAILEKTGLPSPEEKSRMYDLAAIALTDASYRQIGLDHFVKSDDELYIALQNRQLHRNFQGYCTRRTTGQVYAFGVTAISQLASAYAQNSKNIEEYISLIDKGLATVKGYLLNTEEQIVREVIETLMCNYSLDWLELSEKLHIPVDKLKSAVAYDDNRLAKFAADGIVEYDKNRINITKGGHLFVRNVAATFDKLLLNSNKSFSRPV